MRKRYILILSLVSLLLTGCLGGTSTSYVYDGSPTALEVVIKRDAVGPMALSALSDEPEQFARVRIWKENSRGDVIYDIDRKIPIEEITSSGEGCSLSEEVPADKDYNIAVVYEGSGTLEVGRSIANTPAGMLTTTTITLAPLEFTFCKPDEIFGGGSSSQFYVDFSDPECGFRYTVHFATLPWTENFKNDYRDLTPPPGVEEYWAWRGSTTNAYSDPFPNVTEPFEVYYQLAITSIPAYSGYRPIVAYPDLSKGEELYKIILRPKP